MTNKDLKERIDEIITLVNKNKDAFIVKDFGNKDLEIKDYKGHLLFKIDYNEYIAQPNYYSIRFFLNYNWSELRLDDMGLEIGKYGEFDLSHLTMFYRSLFYIIANFEIDDLEPDPRYKHKAGFDMFFDYLDGNNKAFVRTTVENMVQDLLDIAVNDPDLGVSVDCRRGIYEVYDRKSCQQIMKYRHNWDGSYSMQFWAEDEYTIKDDTCCKVSYSVDEPLVPVSFDEFEKAFKTLL